MSKPKSTTRDLVPVGARHVSTAKAHSKRIDGGAKKATTTRAVILRNGKYGARGTGELVLASKLTGREKLDLLADDLVEKSKKAVLAPFRLEQCLKIAESQFNAYLDDIADLQDPDLFYSLIEAEYQARKPPNGVDQWNNPSYIASLISTKIHNTYTLASAWRIILNTLRSLKQDGLTDASAKAQLKQNEKLRARFLVLYDMVNVLVNTSQAKFSVLATTTAHYSRYFKHAEGTDATDPDVVFDWTGLRDACKSFLDSIIIELCFPRAPYPKPILYQILSDAVEESPGEAKRFPQALWDAVGDLSVTVQLQDLLERPLAGPDGEKWKQLPREMPKQFEKWVDAQVLSEAASNKFANFKDLIRPLEKTKQAPVLENMWKYVNLNYKEVSGVDIDTLWQLDGERERTPHWHSFYVPGLVASHDDDDDASPPRMPPKKGQKKKLLAIKDHGGSDSDSSMPSLQSVSNSSDEYNPSDDEEEEEEEEDNDEDDAASDDSGYDTDQEDKMRAMLRVAMDIAHAEDFVNTSNPAPVSDPFAEERKSNPFLTLLGSLRGRMFSGNPKLKTTQRTQPSSHQDKDKPGAGRKGGVPPSHKATVEDVEDEDDPARLKKKKKKKPKKKKKSKSSEAPQDEVQDEVQEPAQRLPPVVESPPASPNPAKLQVPATPTKKSSAPGPSSPTRARVPPVSPSTQAFASSASLALPVEQTSAQSARSYLQAEKLDGPKAKIKSRPDFGSLVPGADKKNGIFSKFTSSGKESADGEGGGAGAGEPEKRGSKHSWFSRLGKKTKGYMHQLLKTSADEKKGIAPMKWDHFLKVMRDMGFKYDPSTAGSSVRFDPPDPRDRPITFHKPHPNPTLPPVKLKEFGKKLKRYYGWCEEDFLNSAM